MFTLKSLGELNGGSKMVTFFSVIHCCLTENPIYSEINILKFTVSADIIRSNSIPNPKSVHSIISNENTANGYT